jgi:hypothetical protein
MLFQHLDNMSIDEQPRFWIAYPEVAGDSWDMWEELGQAVTEVKISFPTSHNTLTSVEEYVQ